MIVLRDKALKTVTKCEPFINVITDETAIAFEKHEDNYKQSSDQIKNGLTKQDGQHYYFEHDTNQSVMNSFIASTLCKKILDEQDKNRIGVAVSISPSGKKYYTLILIN